VPAPASLRGIFACRPPGDRQRPGRASTGLPPGDFSLPVAWRPAA
jgi:hypothetical protein